jgi:hypothetical protein
LIQVKTIQRSARFREGRSDAGREPILLAKPEKNVTLADGAPWPADYKGTGVTTFIAGRDGRVLQKDLGEGTAARPSGGRAAVEFQ